MSIFNRLSFMHCALLLMILALSTPVVNATETGVLPSKGTVIQTDRPLIAVKVGIDLSGMETSVNQAADSITEMANSLKALAENPEMDPEQQKKVLDIIARADQLALGFNASLNKLPNVIKQSSAPIVAAGESTLRDIKMTILLVLGLTLLIVIIALIAIFYTVLLPAKQILVETTSKLNHMASAMETTAHIIETSNQHHQQILASIERHQNAQTLAAKT